MTKWRAIKTAPKDGTQIIAAREYNINCTRPDLPVEMQVAGAFAAIVFWHHKRRKWCRSWGDERGEAFDKPTHWVPMSENLK